MRKKITTFFELELPASLSILVLVPIVAFAINQIAEGFRVGGSDIQIDAYGICKMAKSTNGNDFFVPTRTVGEWQSVIDSQPTGLALNLCAPISCYLDTVGSRAYILSNPLQWSPTSTGTADDPYAPTAMGCSANGTADCANGTAAVKDYIHRYGAYGYAEVRVVYDGKLHYLNSGFINYRKGGSNTSCVDATGNWMNCSVAPTSSTVSMVLGGVTYTLNTYFINAGDAVVGNLTTSAGAPTSMCSVSQPIEQSCSDFGLGPICANKNYWRDSSTLCAGYMSSSVTCP